MAWYIAAVALQSVFAVIVRSDAEDTRKPFGRFCFLSLLRLVARVRAETEPNERGEEDKRVSTSG